jgi:hypothetical protein
LNGDLVRVLSEQELAGHIGSGREPFRLSLLNYGASSSSGSSLIPSAS